MTDNYPDGACYKLARDPDGWSFICHMPKGHRGTCSEARDAYDEIRERATAWHDDRFAEWLAGDDGCQ